MTPVGLQSKPAGPLRVPSPATVGRGQVQGEACRGSHRPLCKSGLAVPGIPGRGATDSAPDPL